MNTHLTTTKKIIIVFVALLAALLIFNISGGVASPRQHTPVKPYLTISVGKSSLSNSGGGVTVRAREHGLTRCVWTVAPKIIGFNRRVDCQAKMSRVAHVPSTTVAHAYTFVMRAVDGKKRFVARVSVIENGPVSPITTTTTTTTVPSTVTATTQPTTTTTTTPTGPPSLAVHLDPSFVASANNPLNVIYTASASATSGALQALTSLPTGVLNFFSDGNLACSTNVGGSVTTTQCPVLYTSLGSHTVVTEYVSGTDSATETDIEGIVGYSTSTAIALTGDPVKGATTSTLTAVVSSTLGTDTTFSTGNILFSVDGVTLTTVATNQTSCTLSWTGITSSGPTLNETDSKYEASATSPNCTMTGGNLNNISSFKYGSSFAGVLGLGASTSSSTSDTWPQVLTPVTNYVAGDGYTISISTTTIGSCTVSGLSRITYCLNAPVLSIVDSVNGAVVSGTVSYNWMATTFSDGFVPTTGTACTTFSIGWSSDSTGTQCPLGNSGQVPNPLPTVFTVTPTSGYLIYDAGVTVWNITSTSAQQVTTVTTHAFLSAPYVRGESLAL